MALIECPICEGAGETYFSCCGDNIKGTIYEDNEICPTCREHLGGPLECEECEGTGKVEEPKWTDREKRLMWIKKLEESLDEVSHLSEKDLKLAAMRLGRKAQSALSTPVPRRKKTSIIRTLMRNLK
jgi:RecJ-like exonuclease